MTTYEGTAQDLRILRGRLRLMRETQLNLGLLGERLMEARMAATADELHTSEFAVTIPCLLCKSEQRSIVGVWDAENTIPTGCICQACNDAHLNPDGSLKEDDNANG